MQASSNPSSAESSDDTHSSSESSSEESSDDEPAGKRNPHLIQKRSPRDEEQRSDSVELTVSMALQCFMSSLFLFNNIGLLFFTMIAVYSRAQQRGSQNMQRL